MDDVPTLPSIQTYLSLFFSRNYLFHNGADIEWLIKCAFYLVVNAIILAPALGQSLRLRAILFVLFDALPILGFIHLISWDWNFSQVESEAYRAAYKQLAGYGGEELAYRKKILSEINGIYFWSKNNGDASAFRAELYGELPAYFQERDKRLAAAENAYEDGGTWWAYRHIIDELNTELSPGLARYETFSPRFEVMTAYASLFVGMVILTIPAQGAILTLLCHPFASWRENGMSRRLRQYNQVEAMNGTMRGSFRYEAPELIVGDIRLNLAKGRWNPRDPSEYFLGTGTVLKFSAVALPKRSIFEQV